MKILFIAPLPPPLNGQSLAANTIRLKLNTLNDIKIVNMAKLQPKTLKDRLYRYVEVAGFLLQVLIKQYNCKLIYLTISESIAGNIKDICIYLLCFHKLKYMFIHMLGGAGMKNILDKNVVLSKLNKFFINRMRGVIVEGQPQAHTFSRLISKDKIHIIPNFAEDYLFLSENEIKNKFSNIEPIRILFLSNLLYGKGHNELANAFIELSDDLKKRVKVIFVGGFEFDEQKTEFLDKISNHENLIYWGNFVTGNEKRTLYSESHIFCLPTYYPYEGQPISILEAYATGCVVITTNHSGIPDIFSNEINGFEVQKKSSASIKVVIEQILNNPTQLLSLALANNKIADTKYRTSVFCNNLNSVFEFPQKSSKH